MGTFLRVLLFSAAALGAALVACSSSDNGSQATTCDQNPFMCGAGTTCWPSDPSTLAFDCIAAGPGVLGGDCRDSVRAATCGAGMFCLQDTNPDAIGLCVTYCDGSHPCAAGTCTPAQLRRPDGTPGPTVHICFNGFRDGGVPEGGAEDASATDGATDAAPPVDAQPDVSPADAASE